MNDDQSKNGVRVIVTRCPEGSTVEADCQYFGSTGRTHSNPTCHLIRGEEDDRDEV